MSVNFPSNANYNVASPTNAGNTTPNSPSTPQVQAPQETSAPPNQNTKSEYKGQKIESSKFEPASGNVEFFAPKENALVALVAAGAAIVGSLSGGTYDERNFKPMNDTINSTAKRLGELGTSAKISPFGGISESDSERLKKMGEQKRAENQQ